MSSVISDDQFQHISKLSQLTTKPDESFIQPQLSQAAEYVEVLKELDTNDIEPTYQVNHKKNVLRPDKITPSFTQQEALSQATDKINGYFATAATIKK